VAAMTGGPRSAPICATSLAALALAAGACGGVTIDVGVGGSTDCQALRTGYCDPDAGAPGGTVTLIDSRQSQQVSMTPKVARYDSAFISIAALAADGSELDIRVSVTAGLTIGTFRCEDPATAERTRIDLTGPNYAYYLTTIRGGQCEISIWRADTTLEGIFTGRLLPYTGYVVPANPNPVIPTEATISGSFSVVPPP